MIPPSIPPHPPAADPRRAFFDHHAPHWDDDPGAHGQSVQRLGHLRERLGLSAGQRVLEVGCGTGLVTRWLTGCVGPDRVTAIDFSPAMLARARDKGIPARFLELDICRQAPEGPGFDLVFCFHAFPHFRDQPAALRHLAQCLDPAGRLIVLHLAGAAQINGFHRQLGGAVGHDRLPEPPEWPALLDAAGLFARAIEDRPDLFLVEAVRRR